MKGDGYNSSLRFKASRHAIRALSGATAVVVAIVLLSAPVQAAATSVNGGAAWSVPVQIEPNGSSSGSSGIYGVSCPTATSCVAVDADGSALFWRNGRWSGPQPVGAGGTLTSVSCPRTTHCLAMSAGGKAVTYDGRSWSPPVSIGPEGSWKVSCPRITFCAAVSTGGSVGAAITVGTLDGSGWSTQHIPGAGALNDRVLDVSCATTRFCVAVDLDGHILTFDGHRWSTAGGTGPEGMISVSCTSRSFCLAVTDSGAYTAFDGRRWASARAIPGFGAAFAYSISCSSTRRCTAIGLSGMAVNWQDGQWSRPVRVFSGGFSATVAVSCVRPDMCMAVNSEGEAATF
jgi:hypothetical protein